MITLLAQRNTEHSSQTSSTPVATRLISDPKRDDRGDDADPDDPNLTRPIPRYNAMLAVLRNTLYMCVSSFPVRSKP